MLHLHCRELVIRAFECECGVADAVLRWLGFSEVQRNRLMWEHDAEYALSDEARERLDALKRGSISTGIA